MRSTTKEVLPFNSRWFTIIAASWLAISAPSLMAYPAPYSDESQLGALAVSYLKTGLLDDPIYELDGCPNCTAFRLYNIALAHVFAMFGIGLLQARAFSMLGTLIGAWLLFWLGRRWYNPTVGLLAAAIYLISVRVLWHSHVTRPDTWVNAAGALCLLLFSYVKHTRRGWQALGLGFLVTAINDIYVSAFYYSVSISAAMLVSFWRRAGWRTLALYILGGVFGTSYWLITRTPMPIASAGYAPSFLPRMLNVLLPYAASPLDHLASNAWHMATGMIGYSRLGWLEFTYLAAGTAVLLWRRQSPDGWLLILWATIIAAVAAVYPDNLHLVYIAPITSLLVAAALDRAANSLAMRFRRPRFSPAIFLMVLATPLIGGSLGADIYLGWANRQIIYQDYSRQLQALVPARSNVFGEGTWWWSFHDVVFIADERAYMPNDDLSDDEVVAWLLSVLKDSAVRVLLIDERFGFSLTHNYRSHVHTRLVDYAQANCLLKGVVEDFAYGVEQGGPAIKRTQVFVCAP